MIRSLMMLAAMAVSFGLNAQNQKTLDIYFIDVEGGQATLFVTPQHESAAHPPTAEIGSPPVIP